MADDLDDSSSDEDDDSILGKSDSEDSDSECSDSESDSDHSEWDLQEALQAIQGDGRNIMHWGHSRLNY